MEAGIISSGSFPPIDRSQWLDESRRSGMRSRGTDAPAPASYADLHFEGLRRTEKAAVTGTAPGWTIVQRIDDPDAKRGNHQAQEDVANGATGGSGMPGSCPA